MRRLARVLFALACAGTDVAPSEPAAEEDAP